MSAKNLIEIGGIWFVVAALWLVLGRTSFSITWMGKGAMSKAAGSVVVYALTFS